MKRLFVFGLGYTASRLAATLGKEGWTVSGTGRAGIAFDDEFGVREGLRAASHVVSSVPPDENFGPDPVLSRYGHLFAADPSHWLGYLSSTGVYGDTSGAWVDESAPLLGRRANRIHADRAWQDAGARVFRLPGIYGPGRSALNRVAQGKAHRIDMPDQIFSRAHVDDIVAGVIAGFNAPPGIYNLADDYPCSQNRVIEAACNLLGAAPPPYVDLETLSAAARDFYRENRRVANGKAKRVLGWTLAYPDFTSGLRALSAISSPIIATAPPPAASSDHS